MQYQIKQRFLPSWNLDTGMGKQIIRNIMRNTYIYLYTTYIYNIYTHTYMYVYVCICIYIYKANNVIEKNVFQGKRKLRGWV